MLTVKGVYRVDSIYPTAKKAYVTFKDKLDGQNKLKMALALPLDKNVKDDALVSLEGVVKPSLYGTSTSLTFEGSVQPVAEGK